MKDYSVLIAHLRECAKYDKIENTFSSAADAIEELSRERKKGKWLRNIYQGELLSYYCSVCKQHLPTLYNTAYCPSCGVPMELCENRDRIERTLYPDVISTNADRIRAMTDEELAKWFSKIQNDIAEYYDSHCENMPELPTLLITWLEWLKQEADG